MLQKGHLTNCSSTVRFPKEKFSRYICPEDSVKGQEFKVRLPWFEGQMVEDGMKIVTIDLSVFRDVFKPLPYFLCFSLPGLCCLLCLAPILRVCRCPLGKH